MRINRRKTFNVRAKPDTQTVYSFKDCTRGGAITFFLFPCKFTLSRTKTSQSVTVYGIKPGSSNLQLDGITGVPPVPIVVFSGSGSPYFNKFDHIQSSCCARTPTSSVCGGVTVQLKSSCSWQTKPHLLTRGIVFMTYDNLMVPLSLAGVTITSTLTTMLPSTTSSAVCAGDCNLTPLNQLDSLTDGTCYEHIPTPDDLSEFVERQSLTKSFLSSIRSALFPSWFNISITNDPDALNKLSNTDYLAKLVSSNILLSERGCESLVIEEKNEGRFLVLQHNGPLNFKIEDEQSLLQSPSLSDYYCIAIYVCSGQNSSVYIGLPPSAQDGIKSISFILNYVRKGWKFDFKSASLSKTPQDSILKERLWNGHSYAEHSSRANLQYDTLVNMEAQGRFSYEVANVNLNFSGFVRYKYTTRRDEVSLHIMNILIVYCYIIIIIRPI